jgi:hypothetical protein|tara:strand:+ start:304 stop:525 length:222 start_codon:yes stop_codon:yes gene_type:complete
MADTVKLQKELAKCMEKYKDDKEFGYSKCNAILEQIPTDTTKSDTTTTGSIGVKGPNYGKTKAKYQRQPRKED